jgi:hypothetical protein
MNLIAHHPLYNIRQANLDHRQWFLTYSHQGTIEVFILHCQSFPYVFANIGAIGTRRPVQNGRHNRSPPDLELEKKLLAIEEPMTAQKIDFEKAQKEIAARDAAEKAEMRLAEERKAWEEKLETEKKVAHARGVENAKKQAEAELKKAEERAAEEAAREEAKAAVLKAELDAKAKVDKAEADAKTAIEKAQKEAKEAIAKALAPKIDKKKPIKFKDAVGRKFSFPFHICATWTVRCDSFIHCSIVADWYKRAWRS